MYTTPLSRKLALQKIILWLIPMALWMESVWLVIGRHYENIVVSRIWYNSRMPFDLVALNSFEVFLSSRFTIHSFIHSFGCFRLISNVKLIIWIRKYHWTRTYIFQLVNCAFYYFRIQNLMAQSFSIWADRIIHWLTYDQQ